MGLQKEKKNCHVTWVGTWLLTPNRTHTDALRAKFGPKRRYQEAAQNYILRSINICTFACYPQDISKMR
jgi:hypothetical protein